MEKTVADWVKKDATGIFRRFPTATAQYKKVSYIMTLGFGGGRRSKSCSTGASNLVSTARKKAGKSFPRPFSEGMTLGTVRKLKFGVGGSGVAARIPSHSSVTMKETVILGLEWRMRRQRLSMGFIWPLPGCGNATMLQPEVSPAMFRRRRVQIFLSFFLASTFLFCVEGRECKLSIEFESCYIIFC